MTAEKMTLHKAMAKAFPLIEGALKDSNNPHFKSKYADLSSVVGAIKPALTANDLFFVQMTHEHQGGVCVETIVCHADGEQMSFGKLSVPASKNDAQGYGSALTYCRRYSLMTAFGVCPEDDDGNAATATAPEPQKAVGINADQLAKIQAEVDRTGTDVRAICAGYKVPALSNLNAKQFADAMTVLRQRPAKQSATPELGDDGIPNFGKD